MPDAAIRRSQARPSLSGRIAPHLPFLRRYARALTGSQESGDAHVVALLEALIADPRIVDDESGDVRIGLYAAFQRLWSSAEIDVTGAGCAAPRERAAHERLGRLTPRARQALLLTAVEGFSRGEAGRILGGDTAEVDLLVDSALAALRDETRARILIVEDEPFIALDIEAIVTDLGHEVVAMAATRASAVAAAIEHRPDLVLTDIQLADGSSGIDAACDILASLSAPVIFITAFPDRLLTGARPEPTFLITKPFEVATVQAAVSQALFFRSTAGMQ
jgi:CheY-like chemotaxis protein